MKIITIKQPWATLIVSGTKNIEYRSWPTNYRGPVLIHAGLAQNSAACIEQGLDPHELKRGGVVGIAEITDCKWLDGEYGFVLRKIRKMNFIPWTGALGLREVPQGLLRRVPKTFLRRYRVKPA
jgi:hypothetical protein